MKNKILLTLVLLIPSLCFGKSIAINFLYIGEGTKILGAEQQTTKYVVKINSEKDPLVFSFKLTGLNVFLNDEFNKNQNKKMFDVMHTYLKTYFPKDLSKVMLQNSMHPQFFKDFSIVSIKNLFLDVAVRNNYQVTEVDMKNGEGAIYLFKED
jgi:hypothetical protein